MISRLTGAVARAFLVVLFISTPSMLLPGITEDSAQIVGLIAIFSAAFTLVEYGSRAPSMVEFRFAAPFNRLRFAGIFAGVFLLSMIYRGALFPTSFTEFVTIAGRLVASILDFPLSPATVVSSSLSQVVPAGEVEVLEAAIGISYVVSLTTLAIFIISLNVNRWPDQDGGFNVWINMPFFEQSVGDDLVARLDRDGVFNIVLGLSLPFLGAVVVYYGVGQFDPSDLESPQPLIWMVSLWTFLPVSLLMRGIAMKRVANMLREVRRERARASQQEWLPA